MPIYKFFLFLGFIFLIIAGILHFKIIPSWCHNQTRTQKEIAVLTDVMNWAVLLGLTFVGIGQALAYGDGY